MTLTLLALGAHLSLIESGELRYIGSLPPKLTLDADGTQLGQGPVLDQRLRTGFRSSVPFRKTVSLNPA